MNTAYRSVGSPAVMTDHYFETKMTEADGTQIPPRRFRTLQGAMAHVLTLNGAHGAIWYQDAPGTEPQQVVIYGPDGSITAAEDAEADAEEPTNYPLSFVPEDTEPGPMMFSLWLHDPQGRRAAYDFGFCWDGDQSADWQCNPGATGSPFFEGTIKWSNMYDESGDVEEEDFDDLGDDLVVTYRSEQTSGQGVLADAAVTLPNRRSNWIDTAEALFGFLRDRNLI